MTREIIFVPNKSLPEVRDGKIIRKYAIAGLIAAFVAAVGLTGLLNPPLPTVQIKWSEETTNGRLLAHNARVWYVFTQTTNEKPRANLLAVPDDKVDSVHINVNE